MGNKYLDSLLKSINRDSKKATAVAQEAMKDIKGDILRLSQELKIAQRASDRAKVEKAIHKRIEKLNRRLTEIEEGLLYLSSQKSVESFGKQSGLDVHFSKKEAEEIIDLVDGKESTLSAVFTDKMEESVIMALRKATLSAIQESAFTSSTLKERSEITQRKWEKAVKDLGKKPEFIDASGRKWDSKRYFEMNIRTNAMRVYNAQLSSNLVENGFDLARISLGGDPHCQLCFPFEGRIVSITGKTKGFPTLDNVKERGMFHPNCTHTLEYLDPLIDEDEIELQKHFPPLEQDADEEEAYDQHKRIDIARKMREDPSIDVGKAETLVNRDYTEMSMRNGLAIDNSKEVVAGLSDTEIGQLTESGRTPEFKPTKIGEQERWNKGKNGGVVHIDSRSGVTSEKVVKVCGLKDEQKLKEEEERKRKAEEAKRKAEEERKRKAEEERLRREAEKKRLEEERRRIEEEKRRLEEERRKQEEAERKRLEEEERKRKEMERRKKVNAERRERESVGREIDKQTAIGTVLSEKEREQLQNRIIGKMETNLSRDYTAEDFKDFPDKLLIAFDAHIMRMRRDDSSVGAYSQGRSIVLSGVKDSRCNSYRTIAHEGSHCVYTHKQPEFTPRFDEQQALDIIATARKECDVYCNKVLGENWKKDFVPKVSWYDTFWVKVMEKKFNEARKHGEIYKTNKAEQEIGATVSDLFCSAYKGRRFFGHSASYYRQAPTLLSTHEIIAEVGTLMVSKTGIEFLKEHLPQTALKVFGILLD